MPRAWIKLWIKECLRGSIRIDLTPEERSVWIDLLLMAGESRSPGVVEAAPGIPYPRELLAGMLSVPVELVNRTIAKCEKEGRININDGSIHITNWDKYQSGYGQTPIKEVPQIPLGGMPPESTLLILLTSLSSWKRDDSDGTWLEDFLKEFPGCTVNDVKACRDYHSARPVHDKGQWKNRLRNWMTKKKEGNGTYSGNTPARKKLPSTDELKRSWRQTE